MLIYNKVAWLEGMLLRTQHFQQQERYLTNLINEKINLLANYNYGLAALTIDTDLLGLGRISILQASGIFPDGTLFNSVKDQSLIDILEVPLNTRNKLVYLALPLARDDVSELALEENSQNLARYATAEFEIIDNTSVTREVSSTHLAKLHLRLLLESDDLSQFASIPIARILEIGADKKIILDTEFIPPSLTCDVSPKLMGYLTELSILLKQRRSALAIRLDNINRSNNLSGLSDFLLLQLLNKYEAVFGHLQHTSKLHPEYFYKTLLELAAELTIFKCNKSSSVFKANYYHLNLQHTFSILAADIREKLNVVIEERALQLPLEAMANGIMIATISNPRWLAECSLVIKAKADMDANVLINTLPPQLKISPVEEIEQLIKLQLPGIKLRALPMAPPPIAYQAGYIYFELEPQGELWQKLNHSAGFAVHAGGNFPNLQLELWAIRGQQL